MHRNSGAIWYRGTGLRWHAGTGDVAGLVPRSDVSTGDAGKSLLMNLLTTPQPCRPESCAVTLGSPRTWANLVTLVRTVTAVVLGAWSLMTARADLLAVAYVVYWVGDMLDGFVARRLDQETRVGAVLDIISDRACTSILCASLLVMRPDVAVSLVPFLLLFMVLDTVLSLSFLCWPIVSPNYFAQVDPTVHTLNWSPGAKAINTAAVVVLALVGWQLVALVLVLALVAVKTWSGLRLLRLLEHGRRP